ncbi:MAG: hypothetical protein ACFCD0_17470 [Gemmataceae bacterium]
MPEANMSRKRPRSKATKRRIQARKEERRLRKKLGNGYALRMLIRPKATSDA